jgi:hypothetical protein
MSCESEQGSLDFPIGYEGGSLESFSITIAEENGAALSSAQIVFKAADSDAAALTLSDGSGLTLTSTAAGGWIITIDQINTISLSPGVYFYNLKTVDENSLAKFYLAGTWIIKNV